MASIKTGIQNIYCDIDGKKIIVGTIEQYEEFYIMKSPFYFDRLFSENELKEFFNNSTWYL